MPTKQVNLRIEKEYEMLLRTAAERIRDGGPAFRSALTALLEDAASHDFMSKREILARFQALEDRITALEGVRPG